MIIFYDTESREITGISMIGNDSSNKIKEPTIKSSYQNDPPAHTGYYYTPNDAAVANELRAYRLVFNSRGKPESLERKPPLSVIHISTDPKHKGTKDVPEMIANGKDQCSITASIRDRSGSLATHFDGKVRFRTTGGVLFDREVKCKNGVAKTTLRSVEETVTAMVTASAPGCLPGEMEIEFVVETVFK